MDAPLDLIQDVLPGTVALAVRVRKGHRSIAILGEERRGSGGLVTYLGEFDAEWEYMLERAIVSTAENPGYAGGPLFDNRGLMVGIVSLNLGGIGPGRPALPGGGYP